MILALHSFETAKSVASLKNPIKKHPWKSWIIYYSCTGMERTSNDRSPNIIWIIKWEISL